MAAVVEDEEPNDQQRSCRKQVKYTGCWLKATPQFYKAIAMFGSVNCRVMDGFLQSLRFLRSLSCRLDGQVIACEV